MVRRYRIRTEIFDYAAFLARQQAAKVRRAQGELCTACDHPFHAGRCVEPNATPSAPGYKIPTFCTCSVGGLQLVSEETRLEVI